VSVWIQPVNDAPVAADDAFTVKQDSSITIKIADLLANDRDIDSFKHLDTVQNPLNGTVQLTPVTNQSPESAVAFTPTPGYCGPAGFDYTLSDGRLTDIGHVDITVICPPPPPHIIAGDDAATGTEDTLLVIPFSDLLANDMDAEGHELTITEAWGINGDAWVEGGSVYFMPHQDWNSQDDRIVLVYRVSDGTESDWGSVDLWIEPVNDPPVTWWHFDVTYVDTPLVLERSDFDYYDVDDSYASISVVRAENPTNGTVSLSDGVVTFTPAPGFCGEAGFDFALSDGKAETTEHFHVFVDGPGC
jgi:hypothetical protein